MQRNTLFAPVLQFHPSSKSSKFELPQTTNYYFYFAVFFFLPSKLRGEKGIRSQQLCLNLQKLTAIYLQPILSHPLITQRQCLLKGLNETRPPAAKYLIARTIATTMATSDTKVEAVEGIRQDVAGGEDEEDGEDVVDVATLGWFCDAPFGSSTFTKRLTHSLQRWSSRPTPEHSPRQQTYRR